MSVLFQWSLFFLLIFGVVANAQPQSLRLVSSHIEPYSYFSKNPSASGNGVVYDIVLEMAHRLGHQPKVEFFPWRRTQVLAEMGGSLSWIGIFPLTRTPTREGKFQWVVPILDDSYVVLVKKNFKLNISKIDDLKSLKIGVLRGTAGEKSLISLGLSKLQVVESDIQNARMLKTGRIDAWLVPYSAGNLYYQKVGLGLSDLKVVWKIMDMKVYFAMNKSVPSAEVEKWQRAFDSMKQDGTYYALMKKYGFKPLRL